MQTFLSTILLFFAFLLLLTGCNPSPSARLETKEKEKPSLPANLSEVDLCGTEKTTEAYLKRLAENKGILGVTKYLDANLNGPTALHINNNWNSMMCPLLFLFCSTPLHFS